MALQLFVDSEVALSWDFLAPRRLCVCVCVTAGWNVLEGDYLTDWLLGSKRRKGKGLIHPVRIAGWLVSSKYGELLNMTERLVVVRIKVKKGIWVEVSSSIYLSILGKGLIHPVRSAGWLVSSKMVNGRIWLRDWWLWGIEWKKVNRGWG